MVFYSLNLVVSLHSCLKSGRFWTNLTTRNFSHYEVLLSHLLKQNPCCCHHLKTRSHTSVCFSCLAHLSSSSDAPPRCQTLNEQDRIHRLPHNRLNLHLPLCFCGRVTPSLQSMPPSSYLLLLSAKNSKSTCWRRSRSERSCGRSGQVRLL